MGNHFEERGSPHMLAVIWPSHQSGQKAQVIKALNGLKPCLSKPLGDQGGSSAKRMAAAAYGGGNGSMKNGNNSA